ncbi:hypothetical protein GGI12_005219 [Dipsacomyces acuminosporus]|nr:hypothetical protein GGI12_005219 [Dipsacomyces acuminosporus]
MTCDGNTVCGQSGSNKAVCHDPSKPTQQQSLTGPILQKCDSVGDGKCASEGKNKYYSCTPQGWQLQTCEGNTICGQVSNNKVTCHDPSKPVDTAANQPKIHCDTLNSTMCDSTDKTSFYSCVNNTWIKMKCDSANICMVRGNKARCVDQATANAPQQPCKHEKATQCAPDNKKIYQLCVDNYWTNSTCANDNYCLYRNGKAICVDKQTAEAPQQPCKTDGATQCAGDDDSIFQICTDNFWTNSTCDKGNVCGMKQGKALCHDPSQPINDVPDQPCDDDKATRCIAGNETLYQVCSSKLWMNLTCDGDNVCRMKDKAVVCVDKNNAGKADGLDYSMGTPTAFVPGKDSDNGQPTMSLKDFKDKLDFLTEQVSILALSASNHTGVSPLQPPSVRPIPVLRSKSRDVQSVSGSADSAKTLDSLFPVVEPNEKDVCAKLFAPLESLPEPEDLKKLLLDDVAIRIPIHLHIYQSLEKEIGQDLLEKTFCIVEEVGNICPSLTPRVETALLVRNANIGSESMQQHVLDAFLMGIMETAQDHLSANIQIDRNANEKTMTKGNDRPDFLLMLNGQLVFKGEEKKEGSVRIIAKELEDKMLPGSVGDNGKLKYLLGYATAGSQVLFECIHEDGMDECSDVIDLAKLRDRITMLIILINTVRIVRAH